MPVQDSLRPIGKLEHLPHELQEAEEELKPGCYRQAGVGLSGGGIRSATLSLGLFQGLARNKLLEHVAFLSTVSGGGYFGGFLGMIFQRSTGNGVQHVEDRLTTPESNELWHLRENGRYLAPNGSGDLILAVAIAVRNWLSLHVVLWTALFALFALVILVPELAAVGAHALGLQNLVGRTGWVVGGWDLSQAVGRGSFVSSWLWTSVPVFVFAVLPLGWAYWLVPPSKRGPAEGFFRWALPVVLAAAGIVAVWPGAVFAEGVEEILAVCLAVVAITVAAYLVAVAAGKRRGAGGGAPSYRNSLSRWLAGAMTALAAVALVGLVDSLGQALYAGLTTDWGFLQEGAAGGGAVVLAVAAFIRKLAVLAQRTGEGRVKLPLSVVLHVAALTVTLALLAAVAALAHWAARAVHDATGTEGWWPVFGLVTLAALAAAWVMGRVWTFVNRSSMHPFYEARLRRAYLGASNPARHKPDCPPITQAHPDDGVSQAAYKPYQHGGPLHLINVTINETVDGRSRIQQQDRKGMGMAVGPAGISVGRVHHALWPNGAPPPAPAGRPSRFRVFPLEEPPAPEPLGVGEWIAISGAAFSTGAGYRTNLGLSLLAGLFNIRLGYWWDSGVDLGARTAGSESKQGTMSKLERGISGAFPVQAAFFSELLARFPGVARKRWYLSDGGHFENMAGYELIRRRLPFTVICDNEEDPTYRFLGLANLVRKARMDFDAEISFLTGDDLDKVIEPNLRRYFGTLNDLRRGQWAAEPVEDPVTGGERKTITVDVARRSRAYAALAVVRYRSGETSHLLYVKPTLMGIEPADVLEYHGRHPAFPQEPTMDQFFDEEQWESYRRLGDHIAGRLFTALPSMPNWEAEAEQVWAPCLAMTSPAEANQWLQRAVGMDSRAGNG